MSTTLQQKAEVSADAHVKYALGPNPGHEEAFCAREDYIAGYMAGGGSLEQRLAFALKQLRTIIDLASQHKEVYSMTVAKYTVEKLK